jgi:RNA polymerase sigma-70 factor (ECF subfamily)
MKVIYIKKPYEEVVTENSGWLLRYIKRLTGNDDYTAEDLLQETLLKCFLSYSGYAEYGKIKSWLACVAHNTVNTYYRKKTQLDILSLDGDETFEEILYDDDTPEDVFLRRSMISDILNAVANMSHMQKSIFNYRIYGELSVDETSYRLGIPAGTVKSMTHYTIRKIQNSIGAVNKKRGNIMTCREVYSLLFVYAKNIISPEDKSAVEEHIVSCKECDNIAKALRNLIPKMTFEPYGDERLHYLIEFMVNGGKELLSYFGCSDDMRNVCEKYNEILKKNDGYIPEGENWFNFCYDTVFEPIGEFDNDGNKIEYEIYINGNKRVRYTRMKKIFPIQWHNEVVMTFDINRFPYEKSKDAPSLYKGYIANGFGCDVRSSIYLAIPENASNIRIKSGNGIHNCGTYKFAYSEQYVTATEDIHMLCTFNIKD